LLVLYRDAALIRALYFRMFSTMRWLLASTTFMQGTPISKEIGRLVEEKDESIAELIADTGNRFVQSNFQQLEGFLAGYTPSLVQDQSNPFNFRHRTTWLSQANLTRNRSKKMAVSSLSNHMLSSLEHAVELNA